MDCEPGGQGLVCHPVDPGRGELRFQAIAIAVRLGRPDFQDAVDVVLDRRNGDRQPSGHLLVAQPLGEQAGDLALPAGEGRQAENPGLPAGSRSTISG